MTDDLLRKSHAHKNKVPVPVICGDCSGTGRQSDLRTCPTCDGYGTIEGEE